MDLASPLSRWPGTGSRILRLSLVLAGCALGAPLSLAINLVRNEVRAGRATNEFSATGRGVIIAILDRGIDYTHPDFRNADGTTRIAAIFDLTDDTGAQASSNPYRVGTLYSRAQINAALTSGALLSTRDAVGHGTTTAGLAAGNGARANGLYRGIAPEATLLIVKVTSDGVPAHDGEPAEAAFYQEDRIHTAIDYVRAKAAELQMPCVMLLNLGSQGGPTDGTSRLARKIDSVVGPGIPGLVFVTGPGDEGGQPNRAAGTLAVGETKRIEIQKGVTGNLRFDLWYADTDRFDVQVTTPLGTSPIYPSPPTNAGLGQTGIAGQFGLFHYGSERDRYDAANAEREVVVDLVGPVGTYTVSITATAVTNGRFDATLAPSFSTNATRDNRFLNFVAPGSIWDGATALYNIAPNSYVLRDQWIDIDNVIQRFTGEGLPGEIWRGSSIGPTFDGRRGVDLSAPGDRTVTTYAPRSYWATLRGNVLQGSAGYYGIAGAVSAAAPITTGAIALMLQMNPALDAPAVKRILQETCRSDAFTGATPNTTWGYGKLDVFAAVAKAFSESPQAGTRGRLANLSILTQVAAGGDAFTMGFVIGGAGTNGTKRVLVRAAGPALAPFGVTGLLADPKLEIFTGPNKIGENDNWGGTSALTSAFGAVGAFGYSSASSLDAAAVTDFPAGGNSVIVSSADGGAGNVIAELYDTAPAASITTTTPRLINVSVLKNIGNGLTVGFVVAGSTGRTVLIRAVGPTIGAAPFNVPGAIGDPQLKLFSGTTAVGENDNWGGTAALTSAFSLVGAFGLPAGSRDAALLATLQPGNHTVQVTGAGNTTGVAIVEVYEVP